MEMRFSFVGCPVSRGQHRVRLLDHRFATKILRVVMSEGPRPSTHGGDGGARGIGCVNEASTFTTSEIFHGGRNEHLIGVRSGQYIET